MPKTVSEIRSEFIKYFIEHQHTHVNSSGLVPDNDPTLMFTNSGMVQFKDVFTGKKVLPFKRATTAQKSLRAGGKHNDLENVGYTARHHTFFEMLGNFSFGDYFKEDAIGFAWEFLTQKLCLPKDKLLVTVHSSDEEAASFWKKIAGLTDDKIIRIPTNDNFWSMGDTGPCGPCSEIFYDHGDKIQGGPPGSPDENGDRFIEIWNLVFMQFETLSDGSRVNLPKPSIDTGMGLERIAAVMQGVHNNYDIDLFKSIIKDIKDITGQDGDQYTSHNNVIADHIRAISFMITDGIVPSNEGRGYVLRRIIRRALRHGYVMGMKDPFLYKLVDSVKNVMGQHYTELCSCEDTIKQVVKSEEESFMKTIDKGMSILKNELNNMGSSNKFPADVAYKLYDTFGFPFDLTQDFLRASGKKVDEVEFEKISETQKEISKKAWAGTGDSFTEKVWYDIAEKNQNIEFVRNTNSLDSEVLHIIKDSELVVSANLNDEIFIVTKKTPFYAESGGQVGDTGFIKLGNNIAEVIDTKTIAGVIAHKCVITSGNFKINDKVTLEIESCKRLACSKNHTATHILQKALKEILGTHVAQKGSLVNSERLRFDFIHSGTVDQDQFQKIEKIVLDAIDRSMPVNTEIMSIEDAKKSGALALFGEKYPDNVRVVTIGDNFSKELCGGEHISNTSQIGCFKILSLSSIGSGIKRIEAVTGRSLRNYFESEISKNEEKLESQSAVIKKLEKQIDDLKAKNFSESSKIDSEMIGSINIKSSLVLDADQKIVLGIIDKEKAFDDERCLVIGNKNSKNGKMSVCVYVSSKLIPRFDAKTVLSYVNDSLDLGIKFGGRPDLAQFGGIDGNMFEKCLSSITKFIGSV